MVGRVVATGAVRTTMGVLALVQVAGLVGCGGPVPGRRTPGDVGCVINRHRILFVDRALAEGGLRGLIGIDDAVPGQTADGRLKVDVGIHNLCRDEIALDVKTVFSRGENGAPLDETNWERIVIGRHETHWYDAAAFGREASDYQVWIRIAR